MTINSSRYDNGPGYTSGSPLAIEGPLLTSGTVFFADSGGSDSNDGLSIQSPKKTLAACVTAMTSGDMLILAPDFSEILTAEQVLPDGVTIVGAGSSGGQPTATIGGNAASAHYLSLQGDNIQLHNIKFTTNVQTNSLPKIQVGKTGPIAANDTLIRGCRFEASATDTGELLGFDSDRLHVEDCTFIVTGTAVTSSTYALKITDTGVTAPVFRDLVFDGQAVGWGGSTALDASLSTFTMARIENMTIKNGSNVLLEADSTGRGNINAIGGSRVIYS